MKGSITESTSACAKNGNARAMQNLLNKYFIFGGEGQESRNAWAEPHRNEARWKPASEVFLAKEVCTIIESTYYAALLSCRSSIIKSLLLTIWSERRHTWFRLALIWKCQNTPTSPMRGSGEKKKEKWKPCFTQSLSYQSSLELSISSSSCIWLTCAMGRAFRAVILEVPQTTQPSKHYVNSAREKAGYKWGDLSCTLTPRAIPLQACRLLFHVHMLPDTGKILLLLHYLQFC